MNDHSDDPKRYSIGLLNYWNAVNANGKSCGISETLRNMELQMILSQSKLQNENMFCKKSKKLQIYMIIYHHSIKISSRFMKLISNK